MQTLMVSRVSRPSRLVTASSSMPLTMEAWRVATESNQPHRRGRPVGAPDSRPLAWSMSADSAFLGGRGPSPKPAGPARGRAELAAHRVEHVGDLGVFGRQRSFANARGVGFHDADHAVHAVRWDARAGAGAAGGGVGRGHERVGAVVYVQKSALRALEQNMVAALDGVAQENDGVGDERP